jgi:hypothetical protein
MSGRSRMLWMGMGITLLSGSGYLGRGEFFS